jgi:nitrite reductase/ring-hydroxylating ferredoxin subunit
MTQLLKLLIFKITELTSVILLLSGSLITQNYIMTFLKPALFFLSLILAFAAASCNRDENDIIPDVYVDFTIDLMDPEFISLLAIDVSDTIDATTNNWGSRSAGYDGNGIIIYSGPEEYYAYDRTCPYDFAVNGLSIKVRTDKSSVALCPHCGTKYALSVYGTPVSGPGNYSLKNYNTTFEEARYVSVWNN